MAINRGQFLKYCSKSRSLEQVGIIPSSEILLHTPGGNELNMIKSTKFNKHKAINQILGNMHGSIKHYISINQLIVI